MSELISKLGIVDIFLKLLLALICGGVLGVDRGRKNRPAGFRTYMLVCVASAIVMITNEYIAKNMVETHQEWEHKLLVVLVF